MCKDHTKHNNTLIDDTTDVISDKITQRIRDAGVTFRANDNIASFINPGELQLLKQEVSKKMYGVLQSLVIDIENDHNTRETADRVAKMFIFELFSGRYEKIPATTNFPNIGYDDLYTTGPITIRSTCAHHLVPIVGKCWVGILPVDNVIGLSKFNRIVNWIASRPQIQEEMTSQIADALEKYAETPNVAVVIKAEHMCLTHRGVKEHESDMTTSIMRGDFRVNSSLKTEFFNLIDLKK